MKRILLAILGTIATHAHSQTLYKSPLYHAVHGLDLYRARRFGPQQPAEETAQNSAG